MALYSNLHAKGMSVCMFLQSMSLCMSLGMSLKGMSVSMFLRGTYTVILLKCDIDRPFSHTHIAE